MINNPSVIAASSQRDTLLPAFNYYLYLPLYLLDHGAAAEMSVLSHAATDSKLALLLNAPFSWQYLLHQKWLKATILLFQMNNHGVKLFTGSVPVLSRNTGTSLGQILACPKCWTHTKLWKHPLYQITNKTLHLNDEQWLKKCPEEALKQSGHVL